jgi:uncharacterized protein
MKGMISRMEKRLWTVAGSICVGLGIMGILLPVLPTTPFLLLAAYCYSRGSQRFYHWLLHLSRFGSYIRNYCEGRGIPVKQKLMAITLLWLTIGLTSGFLAMAWWVKAFLAIVATGVTIHLVKVKTLRPSSPALTESDHAIELVETP